MSRRVVSKTPQARLDLIEAGLYIAEGNPDAADRFHNALDRTFERLAQHPMLGRSRPELGRELRSFPHRNYVIYYRRTSTGVLVVRVLHGARETAPLFGEDR